MTFFHSVYDAIYFNYLSFGTLLSFIFTILLGIYLVTLPGKSKSTFHLGLGFFFMGLFNLSYVVCGRTLCLPVEDDSCLRRGGGVVPVVDRHEAL